MNIFLSANKKSLSVERNLILNKRISAHRAQLFIRREQANASNYISVRVEYQYLTRGWEAL